MLQYDSWSVLTWLSICHVAVTPCRVPTGERKLEKVRESVWSVKVWEKYYFSKVRENDLGSC